MRKLIVCNIMSLEGYVEGPGGNVMALPTYCCATRWSAATNDSCRLRISALTMGTMTFGGGGRFASIGSTDIDHARRQVDQCLQAGVNLIDTADSYSAGLSEEIVGQVLQGRRDEVLWPPRRGCRWATGPNDAGLSRHHLIASCEASLRRLRTDHIDLYQAHEWDGQTPLEETLQALDDLVRAGKVRYVGCSNYASWQLMKALGVADVEGLPRFVSQQIHYTLQAREAEYDEPPVRDQDKLYDIVEVIVAVAKDRGASLAQVALAWLLGRPAVTSVIVGARTEQQLADNLGAADLELTREEQARLEEVSRPPLLYPYWHQAKTASDRLGPADLSLLGPLPGKVSCPPAVALTTACRCCSGCAPSWGWSWLDRQSTRLGLRS